MQRHKLDKTGVVYEVKCNEHQAIYVGETGGPMKERGYEHRIVPHNQSTISHSILKKKKPHPNLQEDTNRRRSGRLLQKEKKDYKKMNRGEDVIINPGNSVVAQHLQEKTHCNHDQIEYNIITQEPNWLKRGIREAIEIRKREPNLNIDQGRYHLSELWTRILNQSDSSTGKSVPENAPKQQINTNADDGHRQMAEISN